MYLVAKSSLSAQPIHCFLVNPVKVLSRRAGTFLYSGFGSLFHFFSNFGPVGAFRPFTHHALANGIPLCNAPVQMSVWLGCGFYFLVMYSYIKVGDGQEESESESQRGAHAHAHTHANTHTHCGQFVSVAFLLVIISGRCRLDTPVQRIQHLLLILECVPFAHVTSTIADTAITHGAIGALCNTALARHGLQGLVSRAGATLEPSARSLMVTPFRLQMLNRIATTFA